MVGLNWTQMEPSVATLGLQVEKGSLEIIMGEGLKISQDTCITQHQ